jgi:serine/threonine-protein kinase
VVYKARDTRLDRFVALKFLPTHIGPDDQERLRFLNEARAASALDHPNICTIHDVEKTDDGQVFIVMPCYEGETLQARMNRGPLPVEAAIDIARQVATGLGRAHARSIVHRDIKPSNIYVCREGLQYDFVKVLDFGLAHDRRPESVRLTMNTSEKITGTPAYMAPEVVLGATAVDPRVDIYALGCVAYFLLTGHLVFEGSTPMKTLLKHVEEAPVPPSQRTEVVVPPALDALILQCLEKDPDRRPKDAQAVLRLVRECRVGTRWSDARARDWWEVHLPELSAPSSI